MLRLTERRHSRAAERSLRRLRDQDVVAFRRALYRTGVRVRTARDSSRPRDVSAAYLRRNPACLRRLLPWLQRELTVLYGSHGSLVSIVQHIIMSRITHHDMDAAPIRDELRPFLLARTDHFLHELVNFARSTLSMEAYDQQAVYECTAPSYEPSITAPSYEPSITAPSYERSITAPSYEEDSASESSIIAISEGDDSDSEDANITQDPTQDLVPPVPMATGGENSLSQSAWDDETPGPSYSTLFPSPSQSQGDGAESATALIQSDEAGSACGGRRPCEDEEGEEEECMIVGYVKPMAERTPELVQLSSDSSEEEEEEDKGAVATETPATPITKTESSLSQVQAPPSSQSYLCPVSPSPCRYPSPSRSPHTCARREIPQHTPVHGSSSEETGGVWGQPEHRDHGLQQGSTHSSRARSRARSRSSSESSVLSECSRSSSRFHKLPGSASRHGEPSSRVEPRGRSQQSVGRSPTVSIPSDSSSGSVEPPRSHKAGSVSRSVSARERSSQSSVCWDSPGRDGEYRRKERRRQRRRERAMEQERSRSPLRSHSIPSSHRRDSRRRHGHRERRPSSSLSSGGGRSSDPPRPEKPAGKRKYKTRHLERQGHRRAEDGEGRAGRCPAERHRGGARTPSRSSSVEIIFERRPADTHSHADRWMRKRKRQKKSRRREAREHSMPAVITIDSDSDRNHGDHVPPGTDLITAPPSPVRDGTAHATPPPAPVVGSTIPTADPQICVPDDMAHCVKVRDLVTPPLLREPEGTVPPDHHLAVPSLDSLLGSSGPATPRELHVASPECTLSLEHCAVAVVGHDTLHTSPPVTAGNHHQDAAVTTEATPSDTRLLESILQELEDILPDTRPALDSGADQQEGETNPHSDQSEAGTEALHVDLTEAMCHSERGAKTSSTI